jgi:cyclopropane-fatty-acyl-phospholipid synthase
MSQRASRTIEFESTRRASRPPVKPARHRSETHQAFADQSRTQAYSNTRSGNRWEDWLAQVCDECGVTINGSAPADPQIHNRELARRAFIEGSMGLGEAYMEGWWDCEALDELATRAMRASIDQKIENKARLVFEIAKARVFNFQKKSRAFQVGEKHYDTGNDLFEIMLDPTMSYSCGYWKGASNLYEAQVNKLDLLCRKLQLEKGMKLLDIGSGWGGLAEHAARNYGVEVLGVTVSKEQAALATERLLRVAD